MIGQLLAGLMGRWSLWSGPGLNEIGVEFNSARYFYEIFTKEAEAWQGNLPEVGWLYVLVGLFYLGVIIYFLRRVRYLEQLRLGWAESRRRQSEAREARASRRKAIEASEAEVAGVSYEAFQALREGNRAFDEGLYADALLAYEEAGRTTPPLSAAWVGRGAALGQLGRHAEARAAFEQAVELNPSNAEALVNLGLTALTAEDNETARSAFSRAVEVDEACARGHYGLAILAAADGAKADLLAHLKRALQLSSALREAATSEPAFASLADDDGCLGALLERFSPRGAKARRAG